jgi:hypothetical protein
LSKERAFVIVGKNNPVILAKNNISLLSPRKFPLSMTYFQIFRCYRSAMYIRSLDSMKISEYFCDFLPEYDYSAYKKQTKSNQDMFISIFPLSLIRLLLALLSGRIRANRDETSTHTQILKLDRRDNLQVHFQACLSL